MSERAHAEIVSIDLGAVRAAPGVVGVLTAADVPGDNDLSPVGRHDEPVLRRGAVEFHGQPIFAVIAETRDAARRAATLAKVEYRELPHVTDVAEAVAAGYPIVTEPLKLERGDVRAAMAAAPHRIKGPMRVGGQDHFYLEGQIAFAVPGEDDEVTVYSSTQHPSEVQHMVAACARRAVERGDDHRAAHGRRLRRQGDAAEPVRGGGGGGGEEAGAGRSSCGPTATTT